jgi:long-chain acyl-CoA synthetase
MPKFNADETVRLIGKNRVNYVIGVPTLFESLLRHPRFASKHLANLRRAFVGGDFVATKLKEDFSAVCRTWNSTAELLEGYGLTEMVTVLAVNTPFDKKPDSVGRPLPGITVKILDVANQSEVPMGVPGEIAVSGPTMMNGYLHDPGSTAATIISVDGSKFVRTGDYGFLDVDGHLHFKQRLKRIVKVSGMPVLPSEIETLVTGFPAVLEAAAIGIPDPERGNMIKLFITVKSAEKPGPSDDEIRKAIREQLSVYAIPKTIVRIDKMPRTVVGKIDTNALMAKYE